VPPNNPLPISQQGYENIHSIRDEVPSKCFVTHNLYLDRSQEGPSADLRRFIPLFDNYIGLPACFASLERKEITRNVVSACGRHPAVVARS
jgi:hypothetical protein